MSEPVDPVDVLFEAMRERLVGAPMVAREGSSAMEDLLAELRPFVESARRAETSPTEAALWSEARSLAWLFAYRMGDQGRVPLAVSEAFSVWRRVAASEWVRERSDELVGLLLDAYARGREDRVRADALKALAEALPAASIAPGAVLVVAAGPLDPEGARSLADRASAVMLRTDAKAALLDVSGLTAPTAAVLAELWSMVSSARMLGVRMVVSGEGAELAAALDGAPLPEEGTLRAPTLTAGVEQLLREAGAASRGPRGLAAWLRSILPGRRTQGR